MVKTRKNDATQEKTPSIKTLSALLEKIEKIPLQFMPNAVKKTERKNDVDWPSIALDIKIKVEKLPMNYSNYKSLAQEVANCPDKEARDSIKKSLSLWRIKNGKRFIEPLHEEAMKLFENEILDIGFNNFIEEWPLLRTDEVLLSKFINYAESNNKSSYHLIFKLEKLAGGMKAAKRFLNFILKSRDFEKNDMKGKIARLLFEWTNGSTWGQLNYDLWAPRTEYVSQYRKKVEPKISDIGDKLRQLPLIVGNNVSDVDLSKMSKASRAEWRRQLAALVSTDTELKEAVTEAILWYVQSWEDLFSQIAVLEINPVNTDIELAQYADHPSEKVRLRAASAISLKDEKSDLADLIGTSALISVNRAFGPSRTWLGDVRIEKMLENALNNAAQTLEDTIFNTLESGEETLVERLFERMGNECKHVNKKISDLAREAKAKERPEFTLSRRTVGKHEEGGKGLHKGAKAFSADICLTMRASKEGMGMFAEHACLIQAKRLHLNKSLNKNGHYRIDCKQIKDISVQTNSSFLLLLGPGKNVLMPIIPANLFLEYFDNGSKMRQIRPDEGANLGKSLASWLVYDVIGLWTGDPNKKVVKKAESGGAGRQSTLFFELDVKIVPSDY